MQLYVLDVYLEKFPNCGCLFDRRITTRQRAKLDRTLRKLEKQYKDQPHRLSAYRIELPKFDLETLERLIGTEDVWDVVQRFDLDA